MCAWHAKAKPTVLVVDDSPAVATTLVWVLSNNGYNSSAVHTRAEALQLCRGVAPDVALIELNLPDGDGVETARELRQRLPECKVLFISSNPEAMDELRRVKSAGQELELLAKPIPVGELLDRIHHALASPELCSKGIRAYSAHA